ncbi:MAG: DUF4328 domain-containing protein [Phycisphaerales bacterium]|nr:DUF4328 domain-containing protein [Phycisphaerales bacterium]
MDFKPHAGLTRALRILLTMTVFVAGIAAAAGVYDYYSYATLPADVDPNEVLLASDAAVALTGLIQFILWIVTAITFLRWIHRSNKNLRALSDEPMEFTPGWSVGWYFVPIANLFKPYQSMKEIWMVSHKDEDAPHSILVWWWSLWLISAFLGRLAFRLSIRAEDANDYAVSALAYVVSDVFDVFLALVALMMVKSIGEAYARNYLEPLPAGFSAESEAPTGPPSRI